MIASVPLQGTYLPYSICAKLPKKWIKFPSPCRGLIFLTSKKFIRKGAEKGFRPLAGDLSSLPNKKGTRKGEWVSVPLQGTYLPYKGILKKHSR